LNVLNLEIVRLGLSLMQLFGGTRGQDDTDAILPDWKVGIGYTMNLDTVIVSHRH
jgi:hypothetical protein